MIRLQVLRFPVLLAAFSLTLAATSCFSEEDFAPCTFTAGQEKVCTTNEKGVEGINCVINKHPDCTDGICIMYQENEPFCSSLCTKDEDCPEGGLCVQFTVDCGAEGNNCAKYCVKEEYVL